MSPYIESGAERMIRVLSLIALPLGLLTQPMHATADTPLPPPSGHVACSPNGTVCVQMQPGFDATVYRKSPEGRRTILWTMPGWHRSAFVSDDGRHLVKCYGGLNLVPIDYDPNMSLVEVWREGTLTHRLSLRAVVGDLSRMNRTASHYAWGSCLRFESATRFVLGLNAYAANGDLIWKKAVLDVVTGQLRRTNEVIPR